MIFSDVFLFPLGGWVAKHCLLRVLTVCSLHKDSQGIHPPIRLRMDWGNRTTQSDLHKVPGNGGAKWWLTMVTTKNPHLKQIPVYSKPHWKNNFKNQLWEWSCQCFGIASTSDQIEVVGSLLMLRPFLKGKNTCLRWLRVQIATVSSGCWNSTCFQLFNPAATGKPPRFHQCQSCHHGQSSGKGRRFRWNLRFLVREQGPEYATTVDGRYHAPNDVVNIPILYRVS